MKLITERDMIRTAAFRFRKEHLRAIENKPGLRLPNGREAADVLKQLEKLNGDAVFKSEVDTILGDDSMTKLWCHQCAKEQRRVVELKRLTTKESEEVRICFICLLSAVKLASEG